MSLRKTLKETEQEGEGDGGVGRPQCGCCSSPSIVSALFFFVLFMCVSKFGLHTQWVSRETGEGRERRAEREGGSMCPGMLTATFRDGTEHAKTFAEILEDSTQKQRHNRYWLDRKFRIVENSQYVETVATQHVECSREAKYITDFASEPRCAL